ncbi:hypothetical protein DFQ01_115110 [Paenibacillus cellulosilyticus]|uniref:Uncharacterized protein n=1 Tax=Paenibacillus cellulosilyticus TaxID=375489 RepID=A0A2V2YZP0_9BACL|nr:hypothetical protein DFQ01_115110 [Paenibacillus cellulosilyticus]
MGIKKDDPRRVQGSSNCLLNQDGCFLNCPQNGSQFTKGQLLVLYSCNFVIPVLTNTHSSANGSHSAYLPQKPSYRCVTVAVELIEYNFIPYKVISLY